MSDCIVESCFFVLVRNVRKFKDVKGCDDAKQELEEVVEYQKIRQGRLGGKLPKVDIVNFILFFCEQLIIDSLGTHYTCICIF